MDAAKRFSAAVKQEGLDLVELTRERTGWTLERILGTLALSTSRYHSWQRRARREKLEDDATAESGSLDQILSQEKHSVMAYALAHPRDGYRRLAWQMIDLGRGLPLALERVPRVERRRSALPLEAERERGRAASEARETERAVAHGHPVPAGGGQLVLL